MLNYYIKSLTLILLKEVDFPQISLSDSGGLYSSSKCEMWNCVNMEQAGSIKRMVVCQLDLVKAFFFFHQTLFQNGEFPHPHRLQQGEVYFSPEVEPLFFAIRKSNYHTCFSWEHKMKSVHECMHINCNIYCKNTVLKCIQFPLCLMGPHKWLLRIVCGFLVRSITVCVCVCARVCMYFDMKHSCCSFCCLHMLGKTPHSYIIKFKIHLFW